MRVVPSLMGESDAFFENWVARTGKEEADGRGNRAIESFVVLNPFACGDKIIVIGKRRKISEARGVVVKIESSFFEHNDEA